MELFPELEEEEGELVALNWLNLVMCVGASFVTVAIGQLGLFGFTSTQQVSDLYPTLIKTPPWVMSSIVLILTVALLVWATAQIFPAFRVKARDGVNHYYVAAALFQIVWVIMCSYQLLFISLFASLALLVFLGLILRDQGKQVTLDGTTEFLIHKFPFVCYFGLGVYVILWNLCIVLVDANVSMNAQYWVALLSLVAMSLASFTSILCDKAEYTIPTLMAYFTVRHTCYKYGCFHSIHHQCSHALASLLLDWHFGRVEQSRRPTSLVVWTESNRCGSNHGPLD